MKTSRRHLDAAGFASARTKVSKGINKQEDGKLKKKSTQRARKITGMNTKETVGKCLQRLPSPTQLSELTQIMKEDPSKVILKHPAIGSPMPSEKFKLQLFPIDEVTCKVLLEGNHNPYLELTLRPRKKISSVVKHLNNKWGIELILFPYEAQTENIADNKKWTLEDTEISADDVYIAVGQPEVFRLRYGWLPGLEAQSFQMTSTSFPSKDNLQPKASESVKIIEEEKQPCPLITQEIIPLSANETLNSSLQRPVPSDESVKIVQNLEVGSSTLLSWADCLTNVSVGQLLSETSDVNRSNRLPLEQNLNFKQIFLNCDSFDAAIADFRARNQGSQTHHSSIWDAEETRHAFPIQETSASRNCNAPTFCGRPLDHVSEGPVTDLKSDSQEDDCQEPGNSQPELQVPQSDTSNLGLSNICWPDFLGPFDSGISSKHIPGADSISLSGLIASSLDAFQNCSLFGVEKAPST